MISTIYIEEDVVDAPVTRDICRRFAGSTRIRIKRYTEIFNRRAQNFRLQKKKPALILAQKFDSFVLPTPAGYGIGAQRNFYFSHMLNCVYDCRYCFLQGMYSSANYVLFVNYEAFQTALGATVAQFPDFSLCFFSGYDCDSLALEPVTGFVAGLLPFFERHPRVWLELRTKSTQIRTLLKRPPLPNVVVAFSFTPGSVAAALEHRVPAVERRIEAMAALQEQGWPLGLRLDPLIFTEDYRDLYTTLLAKIFARVEVKALHSVSLGPFRLPRDFFNRIQRLYPDERLLMGQFHERNGLISYPLAIEQEMRAFCFRALCDYVPEDIIFPCEF